MQVKNDEYKALENFVLHFTGDSPSTTLTSEEQLLAVKAHLALCKIEHRKLAQNNKTWNAIQRKRETNPNYGRPQKEWRKDTKLCKKNGEN